MNRGSAGRFLVLLLGGLFLVTGFESPLQAARIYPSDEGSSSESSSSRRILPSEQTGSGPSSNRILPRESKTSRESSPSEQTQKERILPSESMDQTESSSGASGSSRPTQGASGSEQTSERLLPTTEEPVASKSESTNAPSGQQTSAPQPTVSPDVRYNPNTASVDDLASIPGLSSVLAERIEWYRRQVGPFQERNDLRKVPGIDRRIYHKISNYFHQGPYR